MTIANLIEAAEEVLAEIKAERYQSLMNIDSLIGWASEASEWIETAIPFIEIIAAQKYGQIIVVGLNDAIEKVKK